MCGEDRRKEGNDKRVEEEGKKTTGVKKEVGGWINRKNERVERG